MLLRNTRDLENATVNEFNSKQNLLGSVRFCVQSDNDFELVLVNWGRTNIYIDVQLRLLARLKRLWSIRFSKDRSLMY